jgi:hypothetical protein
MGSGLVVPYSRLLNVLGLLIRYISQFTLKSLLILFKIGHTTCDNASNNDTMMEFFAKYVEEQTKKPFLFKDRLLM